MVIDVIHRMGTNRKGYDLYDSAEIVTKYHLIAKQNKRKVFFFYYDQ